MIKQAEPHHLSEIAQQEREIFPDPWSEGLLARKMEDPSTIFCVAEHEGQIKGYAILQLIHPEAELINIAVAPSHRRGGIGRALLEDILHKAAAKQITSIHLEVRENNHAAIALYRTRGFRPVGLRKHYYENPREHAVRMTHQIVSKGD